MRIIEVINSLDHRAGAEVFVSNLFAELKRKKDVEIKVISLHGNVDASFIKDIDNLDVCNKKRGIDFSASKQFKKIVEEFNPDIIHMHLSCLPTYFLAFGFKKKRWQLIQTIHTIPSQEGTFKTRFLRKKYIKRKLLTLVSISKSLADEMGKMYSIEPIYVNNGIVLKKPQLISFNKRKYDFVIVASFTEAKNHKLLFDAFSKLQFYGNYSLLCVGTGPLLEFYKQYSSSLGLDNKISFAGATEDVYSYLINSKVFVLSSLREGFPITILEALNCGLPIIVPSIGGIPDVISEKNGRVYFPNDVNALTKCMLEIISNSDTYQKIEKENIAYSNSFSMEFTADGYLRIFEEIINKSNIN